MFRWLKKVVFPPVQEAPASGVRARDKKGRYKADDKATPNINEAYKDGKTPPKKRGRPKGSKNKVKK